MNANSINRLARRRRRHLTALAVVLALAGAIVIHHLPAEHVGMGGAIVMCVAMLPAVALATACIVGRRLARHPRLVFIAWPPVRLLANQPLPRARASPVATVVLRL